ncbi:MAG TPA: hypothetical protein VD927_08770 [Chryseosolibacter sp.]|nr:hypothetical protein [Chryseosolibacter sp.]
MRKLDFYFQSFLLAAAVAALAALLADNSAGFFLFVIQFFVGCWQMISAFISLLARSSLRMLRVIHLSLAIAYLLFVYVVSVAVPALTIDSTLMFGVAWLLAVFYYFITWKSTFRKSGKGPFLPHLSF